MMKVISHTCSIKDFEDKGKEIEKQNYQRIFITMEEYTKWRCHMGRSKDLLESKSEISCGHVILGGEDYNIPIQIIA